MEDNIYAEQLRMETIKSLPQTLTVKRQVKFRLKRNVDSLTQSKVNSTISRWKHTKYAVGNYYKRLKVHLRNVIFNVELWYDSMKTIEGHFGSSVAVYFKFLRWLFILNILLIVMTISFITLPQILFNNIEVNGVNTFSSSATVINDSSNDAILQLTNVKNESNGIEAVNLNQRNESSEFEFMDLLTAEVRVFSNTIDS